MASQIGEKIHALRKQKQWSLDKLAEETQSNKGYLWKLENSDNPNPGGEKIKAIAAALDVTPEYLLSEEVSDPTQDVIDKAFYRKYQGMTENDKKKIRQIVDAWVKG